MWMHPSLLLEGKPDLDRLPGPYQLILNKLELVDQLFKSLLNLVCAKAICMRTRNSYFPNNSSITILRHRNKRRAPNVVKPELRTIVEIAPMADNRTMEELLQAPTEGYGEAIVIPKINADHYLHFDISFADALLLMPKFASTIKSLLANKDKLFELAKIPLNENCSAMLLKKLPEKLGDPEDRSITLPKGVAEDVFVKVGKFHFPTDFVVVDFETNPRVPLILGRSFLRTDRALINVYEEEITLRVNDEAVTFNLIQTTRYSSTYDDMSVNRIDVIDIAREEFAQEMLGFSNNSSGGNPTSTFEPIISDSSPFLTPFEGSDFILEEIEAYLKDELISPEIDHADCDPEGDICLIEKLLNDNPFQLFLMDLKQGEVVKEKSSIKEPLELELKDLPSHLEYAYLEGVDKLPIIIVKDLKYDEKEAPLKEDYKPAVQSQRRVNPKIHEVIKKEVIKLLNAGMIYPISDSPWVSPIHCVPKKGGITVVENENNEFIPTQLVTGWRVCIDYRKLNDATRKDQFPLPFMDQMLERLARNEFYCFLDGFSGYFQIPINPPDQEKTTFTCPYETFVYRRMPFGLCNAPVTFQRCMMTIFHDMIEKTMDVFMDDFLVFGDSFSSCLSHLVTMLQQCEDTNLVLDWEKCHFMVKEGIVLGHKISKNKLEVDRSKVDVFAKLPHPTTVKVMSKYGVTHRLATAYHPQTSGQVKVSNSGLKRILERTHKAYWALKHATFDLKTAGDHRKLQLNELNELRDQAYENSLIYKEKTKKLHDPKIKNRIFNVGDRVFVRYMKSIGLFIENKS
nr:reverse transcriptase domain-containing protein [Tanacetum cinerariifolium]